MIAFCRPLPISASGHHAVSVQLVCSGNDHRRLVRLSRLRTVEACQRPPRAVINPPSFKARAKADCDVIPLLFMSSMTSNSCSALESASALIDSMLAAFPLPASLSAAAPLGLPNICPRAFAACSASCVRLEIALRSAWATAAMMCTVNSFASGMSAATNLTPLSCSVARKATFRDSRSSLATTNAAPVTLARYSAFRSSGRSERFPLSTSVKGGDANSHPLERHRCSTACRWASMPNPDLSCAAVDTL